MEFGVAPADGLAPATSHSENFRAAVERNEPLLMRGVASGWPALRWNATFLTAKAGEFSVVARYFAHAPYRFTGVGDRGLQRISLRELLGANLTRSPIVLASEQRVEALPPLLSEIDFSPFHAWSAGLLQPTSTSLFTARHTELHHHGWAAAVAVALAGSKRFILWPPNATRRIDGRDAPCAARRMASWCLEDTACEGAPFLRELLRDGTHVSVTLQPGDALYIPPWWWHTVHAQLEHDDGDPLATMLATQFMKRRRRRTARPAPWRDPTQCPTEALPAAGVLLRGGRGDSYASVLAPVEEREWTS